MHAAKKLMAYLGLHHHNATDVDVTPLQQRYNDFLAEYGISYGTQEEYLFRYKQFARNDNLVQTHNADTDSKWKAAHNHFSVWTVDEFKKMHNRRAYPHDLKHPEPEPI